MRILCIRGLLVACVLLSLLASGPAEASPCHRKRHNCVKIGTQAPQTGPQATLGRTILNSVELAVKQHGSHLGFEFDVVNFDDGGVLEAALSKGSAIVGDDEILLVISHPDVRISIATADIYEKAQLATLSPANTHPLLTARGYKNVFRVVGRDDLQTVAAAMFAKNNLSAKTAYVLHERTPYGQLLATVFSNSAKSIGIAVLGVDTAEAKPEFAKALQAIEPRKPDLIFFSGSHTVAAILLQQLREFRITATVLGTDALDTPEFARVGGPAVVGVYYTSPVGPASAYPAAGNFSADYRKTFGIPPERYAAQAYDATVIGIRAIESAIRAAGGVLPTRQAVNLELRKVRDFQGITGTLAFASNGDLARAMYFVFRAESADPARWNANRLVATFVVPP